MTELALRIAEQLATVVGIRAVVLGGSRASGRADASSDLDLGLYYRADEPFALAALEEVATVLQQGRPFRLAAPGEWGPWMNGGGWLEIEGLKVDWVLRELGRVAEVFDACIAGRVQCDYYLGHPHGFHNHYYLAEVHHAQPLYDPEDLIAKLKRRLIPYPPKLRQSLIEKYLYDAGFMWDAGMKSVPRSDVLHASGCLFRCAAALVQVVFALNRELTMNEKKSLAATERFERAPRDFASRVSEILAAPGNDPEALAAAFDRMHALREETRALAPVLSYSWPPA